MTYQDLENRVEILEYAVARLEEKVAFWINYLNQLLRELEESGVEVPRPGGDEW